MNLEYQYGGAARSVESILEFCGENSSDFWSEPFFYFFPEIDKKEFRAMDTDGRRSYLNAYFTNFEKENRALLNEKVEKYNGRWQLYRPRITQALEDAFGLELKNLFNDMRAYITFNPVSPRFLEDNSFDVFYLNSENGALGVSLHEIIHFVWFYVWNMLFKDSPAEYEASHIKWILSESVVEPIMRDERLSSINPYYESKSCVYPYFYTLQIEGRPVLDTLYDMYSSLPIKDFMHESYGFYLKHEAEIRAHIAQNNG